MARPPCPQSLPVHIHRYRKQTQEERRPAEDEHNLLRTGVGNLYKSAPLTQAGELTYPVISEIAQPIKHKVLKQHIHDEDLVALSPKTIQSVA
jgi:hypothetical protein